VHLQNTDSPVHNQFSSDDIVPSVNFLLSALTFSLLFKANDVLAVALSELLKYERAAAESLKQGSVYY